VVHDINSDIVAVCQVVVSTILHNIYVVESVS
jgi:hypothetical protein